MEWRKLLNLLLLLAGAFLVSACSATVLSGSWSDPSYAGGPVRKVMVIGVTDNDLVRRMFEDEFTRQFKDRGVTARSSYTMFTYAQLKDRQAVEAKVREQGIDKVLVSRLVKKRTEDVTSPGYVRGSSDERGYYGPSSRYRDTRYRNWYSDYSTTYDVVYQPATTYQVEVATIESNLYDLAGGQPVWSAVLETELGGNRDEVVKSFVDVVVKDLKVKGFL